MRAIFFIPEGCQPLAGGFRVAIPPELDQTAISDPGGVAAVKFPIVRARFRARCDPFGQRRERF
jgi:hypothetical protein